MSIFQTCVSIPFFEVMCKPAGSQLNVSFVSHEEHVLVVGQ